MARTKRRNNDAVVIPLLIQRSCHLPGYTWMQDWQQYMCNNHALFGICLHDRRHPVETWERCLSLAGSIAFGLFATTLAYLWQQYDVDGMERSVVTIGRGYSVTWGMLLLWTLGGICHSLFDLVMWHVMACACCHAGGRYSKHRLSRYCKDCGSYSMIPIVLGLVGMAVWAVLLRASDEVDAEYDVSDATNLSSLRVPSIKSFRFLKSYAIELVLAWLVYFPVVGTIIFSGLLGCQGRLPLLGGRPRDKRLIEEGKMGVPNDGMHHHYASF